MKKLNNSGIIHHLLLIIVAASVIAAVGFTGWRIFLSNEQSANAESACQSWSGTTSLADTINKYSCVEIQPGTYEISKPIPVFGKKIVKGVSGKRDQTVLKAVAPWQTTIGDGILNVFTADGFLNIDSITLDANNIATYSLVSMNMNVDNVRLRNGTCSALGITGKNVTVKNSIIEKSGYKCGITGGVPVGAGIYGEVNKSANGTYDRFLNPVIENNLIERNFGPGVDINGVWGGTFKNNIVRYNSDWAGVSIYGGSYWNISYNQISHPATKSYQIYHKYCAGGPYGKKSAALILCQDTGKDGLLTNYNTVIGNKLSSNYGILVIGADELVKWYAPRLNTFKDNDIFGSYYPCADDLKLKQWYSDTNTWTNNKCGTYNGQPIRF
ncbi:hypothetical protein KC878_03805 [Candidatus Saccharibacteria bacterium]|nr:hypothetical protein [Candidatus Saccharibacteria bacterium]MCB9821733.1 hypothetical protein [Candidatus Nomurabacteria bacterium]